MEEEILNRMQALPERRNPFDEGIAKAVSNSRSNLGMNRDQEHRAINNALLALGNGLATEPVQRGFKNNLGVIGRAMNPALNAYNTSEDTAIAENERLANQILQHQRAEQALADTREDKAWHRKFQERQLEETKRAHNLLDNFRKEELQHKKNKYSADSELDRLAPKIMTDSKQDKAGEDAKKTGAYLKDVREVKENYEKLKNLMKEKGINVDDPFVFEKSLQDFGSFMSRFSNDPIKKKIAALYNDLYAASKKIAIMGEQTLKGAAPTDSMIKYTDQNNLYPTFGKDSKHVFEQKLHNLEKEAEGIYNAAALSSRTKRFIDKNNYKQIKQFLNVQDYGLSDIELEEEHPSTLKNDTPKVRLYDPNTNQYFGVPADEVELAIKDHPNLIRK